MTPPMTPPKAEDMLNQLIVDYIESWLSNATYVKDTLSTFSFDHAATQQEQGEQTQPPKVVCFSTEKPEWYLQVTLDESHLDPTIRQRLRARRRNLDETLLHQPGLKNDVEALLDFELKDLGSSGFVDYKETMTRSEKVQLYAQWKLQLDNREDLWPTPPWSK